MREKDDLLRFIAFLLADDTGLTLGSPNFLVLSLSRIAFSALLLFSVRTVLGRPEYVTPAVDCLFNTVPLFLNPPIILLMVEAWGALTFGNSVWKSVTSWSIKDIFLFLDLRL